MKPISNSALANIIILASISSSAISLSYESYISGESIIPSMETNYTHTENLPDWKDNAFNTSPDYQLYSEVEEKILTIVNFSRQVLSESSDIDSEYVDIVNQHFWDLI